MITLTQFYECAGGNADETLVRLGINEDIIKKFLKKFLSDSSFHTLEQTLDLGDLNTAFRMAHSLKGLSANLGLQNLFSKASEVTEYLRAGNTAQAKNSMPGLKTEYINTSTLIADLCQDSN